MGNKYKGPIDENGFPQLVTMSEAGFRVTRAVVPKGTTNRVMDSLFPPLKSVVPTDEERRVEVYYILKAAGAVD